MVKKLSILLMICALLVVGFLGCSADTQAQGGTHNSADPLGGSTTNSTLGTENPNLTPKTCPPTVIIDGEEYRHWSIARYQVEIGEDEILGYITSVVGIDKMPTKNDEANCCELNTPYARWNDEEYGEVYVIKVNRNWYILLPADYPID